MYYLKDKVTGNPYFYMKVSKSYNLRILAEKEKEKTNESIKCQRVDVVEISESARLYLENQQRLNHDYN